MPLRYSVRSGDVVSSTRAIRRSSAPLQQLPRTPRSGGLVVSTVFTGAEQPSLGRLGSRGILHGPRCLNPRADLRTGGLTTTAPCSTASFLHKFEIDYMPMRAASAR